MFKKYQQSFTTGFDIIGDESEELSNNIYANDSNLIHTQISIK